MAKFFNSEKRKKRLTALLCGALSVTLSLGVISACTDDSTNSGDDSSTPTPTDVQRIKNGNFEFFAEMNKEFEDKHDFINSPSSYNWSFSAGSPSSYADSGIIKTDEWAELATSKTSLILASDRYEKDDDGNEKTDDDGNKVEAESGELTEAAVQNALKNWDNTTIRDRVEFYTFYGIDSADEFEKYEDDYYSIDFNDIKNFKDELPEGPGVHDESTGETGVLMIHNRRDDQDVYGTAQYYTSSTTITLSAGTAAEVSVWVKTAALVHYNNSPVTKRAGAYIGVSQTVGGTSLDQMQIKNINTESVTENNGWKQYTVYIRANTFATTTFRIVLGLGQGSSSNRYEYVDGYAFFDDLTCNIISDKTYTDKTKDVQDDSGENGNFCDLNSVGDAKKFYATDRETGELKEDAVYNIDLSAKFEEYKFKNPAEQVEDAKPKLTEEVSGSKTITSESIDASLGDNRTSGPAGRNSIIEQLSLGQLEEKVSGNGYLQNFFEDDFGSFPFENEKNIIFMLSTNGAAWTMTLPSIELDGNSRMLFSFFVKTSNIRSGASGAGATLVDGENRTTISPFNSTLVSTVDIDDEEDGKDIYNGWVQCFFFVENSTDEKKEFHIELTYGPTTLSGTTVDSYCPGYAAFANFEIATMSKTQYSYAATGTYAQKTSLTSTVRDSSKFDDASASGTKLENGLATPANYAGVQAGSNRVEKDGWDNPTRKQLEEKGLYTGLLSEQYAEKYALLDHVANPWLDTLGVPTSGSDWWKTVFGNGGSAANGAYQPLVIVNTGKTGDMPSYGFTNGTRATVSANSSSRISVRVKLSAYATAFIYLVDATDSSSEGNLKTTIPTVTFWYDDDGNIVSKDPSSDEFDEETDILFTLQDNGLYKNAKDENDKHQYANLSNFDKDDDQNLVTTSKTIAYYYHDHKYYAYYDKDAAAEDQYTVEVTDLADFEGIEKYYRYSGIDNDSYEACIEVKGDAETNADKWVTVTFYVQTGNTAKNYRVELWAGDRYNKTDGLKANSYVFFDRISTSTASNYTTLRDEAVDAIKHKLNEGKTPGEEGYIGEDDRIPDEAIAQYYTFTFFDSPDYLRYDKTQDEDELGNPWGSYKQSNYEEALVYLFCEDPTGELLGTTGPSLTKFISFTANEVTVTPDDLGSSNSSTDSDTTTDTDDNDDDTNIWLALVSILLVVALLIAIVTVIVRRFWKPKKSTAKKAAKKPAKRAAPAEKTEPEAPAAAPDENDPYND